MFLNPIMMYDNMYTVDLVIFARFLFESQFSQGGQIREFKNLTKIIIIIALPIIEIDNS